MKKSHSLLISIIFFLVSLWLLGKHEMWRDELQAWLLVRDSSNLISLSQNLKFEGHPGLWHLILFPLTRISSNPLSMQIIHLLISTCSVYVLFKWSPFTRIQKIFLTFSYFLFYEYSLIARSYGLSTLLIFIFCKLFENKQKNIIKISFVLVLLSHTSIFGLFISVCLFMTIIIENFIEFFTKERGVKNILKRSNFIALFISIFGFLTSLIQLLPPKNSPVEFTYANTKINIPSTLSEVKTVFLGKIETVFQKLFTSYIPIPTFKLNFWGSTIAENSLFLKILFISFFIYIVVIFLNYLKNKPSALFLYLSSSSILFIFFLLKFTGSIRHHGFFFIVLVASLWISKYCFFRNKNKFQKKYDKKLNFATSSLFALQAIAGIIAVSIDVFYPFSSAKETADFLRKNNLINSQIISYRDFAGSAVLGHLPERKSFYYLDSASNGSYVKWDNTRERKIINKDLEEATLNLSAGDKDVVLILNDSIDNVGFSDKNFREIFVSKNAILKTEKFYVYLFKGSNKSLIKNKK